MAMSGTTCPCCGRAVAFSRRNKILNVHMPYERKSEAFLLDRGRRCIGSGKTSAEAQAAAEERTERRREWFASQANT